MKQFLVFGGYARSAGGWHDFLAAFERVEEAAQWEEKSLEEWWHVVDFHSGEIVLSSAAQLKAPP